jgi:hypothetical protein
MSFSFKNNPSGVIYFPRAMPAVQVAATREPVVANWYKKNFTQP